MLFKLITAAAAVHPRSSVHRHRFGSMFAPAAAAVRPVWNHRSLFTVRESTIDPHLAQDLDDTMSHVVKLESSVCDLTLLGTHHDSEAARSDVYRVLHDVRPGLLFLELDETRMHYLHHCPQNEVYVACIVAAQLEIPRVVLGDLDYYEHTLVQLRRGIDELSKKNIPKEKIVDQLTRDVLLDPRDRYMAHGLIELSKESSSIVAIVESLHLLGMTHILQRGG